MTVTYPYLYVYWCARDDGYHYAVGIVPDNSEPANGSLALFQAREDAHTFAYAKQAKDGGMVRILPSADLPS